MLPARFNKALKQVTEWVVVCVMMVSFHFDERRAATGAILKPRAGATSLPSPYPKSWPIRHPVCPGNRGSLSHIGGERLIHNRDEPLSKEEEKKKENNKEKMLHM